MTSINEPVTSCYCWNAFILFFNHSEAYIKNLYKSRLIKRNHTLGNVGNTNGLVINKSLQFTSGFISQKSHDL